MDAWAYVCADRADRDLREALALAKLDIAADLAAEAGGA